LKFQADSLHRVGHIIKKHCAIPAPAETGEVERLSAERDAWRRGAMLLLDELGDYESGSAPHIRVRRLRAELCAAQAERLEIQRALASTVLEDPTEDDDPPYSTREIVNGISSLEQRRRAAVKRAAEARANAIRECVEKLKTVKEQHLEAHRKLGATAMSEFQKIRAEECSILAESLESLAKGEEDDGLAGIR
jgi:hypothetical protein